MKVLENGDYELSDGRIIKASEIGKLHEKHTKKSTDDNPLNLEEGGSSGPIHLED